MNKTWSYFIFPPPEEKAFAAVLEENRERAKARRVESREEGNSSRTEPRLWTVGRFVIDLSGLFLQSLIPHYKQERAIRRERKSPTQTPGRSVHMTAGSDGSTRLAGSLFTFSLVPLAPYTTFAIICYIFYVSESLPAFLICSVIQTGLLREALWTACTSWMEVFGLCADQFEFGTVIMKELRLFPRHLRYSVQDIASLGICSNHEKQPQTKSLEHAQCVHILLAIRVCHNKNVLQNQSSSVRPCITYNIISSL